MAKINAYLTKYGSLCASDLAIATEDELARGLWLTHVDFSSNPDYVLAGNAEVVVTLLPRDEIVAKRVEALRNRKQAVQADAQMEVNSIDGEIQKLLAITNEVRA